MNDSGAEAYLRKRTKRNKQKLRRVRTAYLFVGMACKKKGEIRFFLAMIINGAVVQENYAWFALLRRTAVVRIVSWPIITDRTTTINTNHHHHHHHQHRRRRRRQHRHRHYHNLVELKK